MQHAAGLAGASDFDILKAEDSVLEPRTVDAYNRFVQAGNLEDEAKEIICESYEGMADIVNLAISWVDLAGGDGDAIVDEAVKQQLVTSFSPDRADAAFLAATASEWPPAPFLDELNRSSTWQPVVQELANKHKGSSLLYHMKQRDGFSALDAAIADSPEKFIASFVQLIEGLASRASVTEDDLRAFYDVARQRAAYDENTLVLSLRLLAEVARVVQDPNMKAMLRRCAQEIRMFARENMSQVANVPDHIALQFSTRIAIALESHSAGVTVSKGVLSALAAILSSDKAKAKKLIGGFKEEIHMLNRIYEPLMQDELTLEANVSLTHTVAQRDATVQSLCHPEVFYGMLRMLFVHSVRSPNAETGRKAPVDETLRNCLCMMVALATVAIRNRSYPDPTRDNSDAAYRADVRKFESDLRNCVQCCENLFPGCARKAFDKGSPLQTLQNGIDASPAIAYGVIQWAQEGLLRDPEPLTLVRTAVKYLALLEYVAHVTLREDVLKVFADAYGHQLYAKNDLKRVVDFEVRLRNLYGEALVCLLRLRMATKVVQVYRVRFAEDDNLDRSFLRKFVGDVLKIVAPPYSAPFAAALLSLLSNQRVVDALVTRANRDLAALVSQFLDDIQDPLTYADIDRKTLVHARLAYSKGADLIGL
jgi:hypothetical protein